MKHVIRILEFRNNKMNECHFKWMPFYWRKMNALKNVSSCNYISSSLFSLSKISKALTYWSWSPSFTDSMTEMWSAVPSSFSSSRRFHENKNSAYSRSALKYYCYYIKTPLKLFPGLDLKLANCWYLPSIFTFT